jgi:hypothetical protein
VRNDFAVFNADVFGDDNPRSADTNIDCFGQRDQRLTFADMHTDGGVKCSHLTRIFAVLERIAIALRRSAKIFRSRKIQSIS